MLQAMNTGHDGSLTTIHANSPRDALYRLDTMVAMANLNIPERAVRQQIASAVNLVDPGQPHAPTARARSRRSPRSPAWSRTSSPCRRSSRSRRPASIADGRVIGTFRATGIRPKCAEALATAGFPLPMDMFEHRAAGRRRRHVRLEDCDDPGRRRSSSVFIGMLGAYWFFVVRPEQQALGRCRRRLTPTRGASRRRSQRELLKQQQALSAVGAFDSAAAPQRRAHVQPPADADRAVGRRRSRSDAASLACGLLALVACFVGVMLLIGDAARGDSGGGCCGMRSRSRVLQLQADPAPAQVRGAVPRGARPARARAARRPRLHHRPRDGGRGDAGAGRPGVPAALRPAELRHADARRAARLFAERIPVLDARFFVTAVLIQRESGGNLSEVLDNLASVMRERFRVKRQMRVMSAHGRITGWVLVGLPPVLGVRADDHQPRAPRADVRRPARASR